MDSIAFIKQLGPGIPALEYDRYVALQTRLRDRRRECVLFCSHPPTITAGVQAQSANLRSGPDRLDSARIQLVRVGRAGDHTAHEPGQCVIYPHVDLRRRALGVVDFFDILLQTTARALAVVWNVAVESRKSAPGLYRMSDGAKLVSIGIMFKSFFTSYGLAVNVDNDMQTFRHIHPCGFADQRIGSIYEGGQDPKRLPEFLDCWSAEFRQRLEAAGATARVADPIG